MSTKTDTLSKRKADLEVQVHELHKSMQECTDEAAWRNLNEQMVQTEGALRVAENLLKRAVEEDEAQAKAEAVHGYQAKAAKAAKLAKQLDTLVGAIHADLAGYYGNTSEAYQTWTEYQALVKAMAPEAEALGQEAPRPMNGPFFGARYNGPREAILGIAGHFDEAWCTLQDWRKAGHDVPSMPGEAHLRRAEHLGACNPAEFIRGKASEKVEQIKAEDR